MPLTLHRRRPGMGTCFEAWLVGDDAEHLAAVGDAALDEVERVERLLSRHDPRSELSRINREARSRPVRVDHEFMSVLSTCRAGWERTGGFFDPAAGSGDDANRPTFDDVEVDESRRTVRFARDVLALDLGGFGKGYALDRAAEIVAAFGVTSALLHGGTSSVLALGRNADGEPWPLGVRDPFAAEAGELFRMGLSDRALSCSSAFAPRREVSDLIDPHSGRTLERAVACVVLERTAAEAEILSTALLAMGKTQAARYAGRERREGLAIAWLEPRCAPLWLTGTP